MNHDYNKIGYVTWQCPNIYIYRMFNGIFPSLLTFPINIHQYLYIELTTRVVCNCHNLIIVQLPLD